MRDSTWAFAVVEIVHLIVLAIFGGAVLFTDLRLLNVSFRSVPAPVMAREMLPLTSGGAVCMFLTGALLLISGPTRYYYNTPFWIKMWLFAIAVIVHFILQIRVARMESEDDRATLARKIFAAASLLLWAGVGVSGRAIGYF